MPVVHSYGAPTRQQTMADPSGRCLWCTPMGRLQSSRQLQILDGGSEPAKHPQGWFADLVGENPYGGALCCAPETCFEISLWRSMHKVLFLNQTWWINLVITLSRVNRLHSHEFPDFSTWLLAPCASLGFSKELLVPYDSIKRHTYF
jgi:hypothetical protein